MIEIERMLPSVRNARDGFAVGGEKRFRSSGPDLGFTLVQDRRMI
jgi:hypothetical protein